MSPKGDKRFNNLETNLVNLEKVIYDRLDIDGK